MCLHKKVCEGSPAGLAVEFLQDVRIVLECIWRNLLRMQQLLCQVETLEGRKLVVLLSDSCL